MPPKDSFPTLTEVVNVLYICMRPDLIVFCEVVGPEAVELLSVMNLGKWVLTTIHSNSAYDALLRLETLARESGMPMSAIRERIGCFDNKLYLEFGGKLLFDYHASRVLPGFDPNVKMRLLNKLKDQAEIIICIYAGDIERKKIRADFGISYDADTFKLIDDL